MTICGIDLGTTYSAISFYDESSSRVDTINLNTANGSRTIRSVVYFPAPGSPPVVGDAAWNAYQRFPDRVVYGIKQTMGTAFKTPPIDGKEYTPPEITAEVLRVLAQDAIPYLGEPAQEVIITVPAYFGAAERAATLEAGHLAGLNVRELLPEPHAAALAFFVEKIQDINKRYLLVYDLGGGTFDVTLIQTQTGNNDTNAIGLTIKTLCKDGNAHLGGLLWDKALMELVAEKIMREHKINICADMTNEPILMDNCEKGKIILSQLQNVKIIADKDRHTVAVTRDEFEDCTRDLLTQTDLLLNNVLLEAESSYRITRDKIDVLLAGGSTSMPMVKKMIQKIMGKPAIEYRNPDLLVTIGAAYRGKILGDGIIRRPLSQPEVGTTNTQFHKKETAQSDAIINLTTSEIIAIFRDDLKMKVCDDRNAIEDSIKKQYPRYIKEERSFNPTDSNHARDWFKNVDLAKNQRQDMLDVLYKDFSLQADLILKNNIAGGKTLFTRDVLNGLKDLLLNQFNMDSALADKLANRYVKDRGIIIDGALEKPEVPTDFTARGDIGKISLRWKMPVVPAVINDLVHFSVTSPQIVACGDNFLMDVWAHLEHQRQEVINRAREEAGGADIRIKSRGPIELARGNVLTVRPIIRGFSIEPLQDTILWEGEIGNATFTITVPENAKLGSHPGFCEIHLNGLKISSLHFIILVATNGGELSPINSHEVRHRRVFASYASEDRDAVLARIQGLLKGIPDLKVFLDVASLHSGVRWQDALKAEILKSDLMYLFWSRAARESEWVDMEWRLGYREKGIDFIDPVPLVSPMEVPPPSELAELHFNDWILAYMRNTSSPNMESD